jgi:hypothetical protein
MHHLATGRWRDVKNLSAEGLLIKLEGAVSIANRQMRRNGVVSVGYGFYLVSHRTSSGGRV